MLCAELEQLEAQFDDIITALENPDLTKHQRDALEEEYTRMCRVIKVHQASGHEGKPCFEE